MAVQERILSHNLTARSFLFLAAAAGCVLTTTTTAVLANSGWKLRAVVLFAATVPLLAWVVGSLKDVLVFCWVGSLTYNRQFFSFDSFLHQGAQGFYWVLGDIFLLALLLLWLYEAVQHKQERPVRGRIPPLWPYFLPFAGATLLSLFAAQRLDWSIYELTRYVRFALILWYVSCNVRARQWWIIIAALSFAMAAQSLIAVKEVITGQSGVFGDPEIASRLGRLAEAFSQEAFYGMVRGTATMNHPPNLASYLTLVIPVVLALSLTFKNLQIRLVAALFFVTGAAGLAATMSRLPWAMTACAVALVFLVLAHFREISLKGSLGTILVGTFGLFLCIIPVRDKVMNRITGDFSASIDQRAEGLRAAMNVFDQQNPLIGVGLNNTRLFVEKFLPSIAWMDETDQVLLDLHIRAFATLGNAFTYVAVETGVIGFLTFVLLLAGTFLIGWRAVRRTMGPVRGVALGLTLGWLAMLGGQFVDNSIFVDPLMYTMAIVIALLNLTPTIFPSGQTYQGS